jgi:hypothetical protein
MKSPKLLVIHALALLLLVSGWSCRGGKASGSRATPEQRALRALAKDPERLRERVYGAEIEVPDAGTRLRLELGRAVAPGDPSPWSVEIRSLAGVVELDGSLDVFVDLAVHRMFQAPVCYLALFRVDLRTAEHRSTTLVGKGAKILSVEEDEEVDRVKGNGADGPAYELKVDLLLRAPQGDWTSHPTIRKRGLLRIADHRFVGPLRFTH